MNRIILDEINICGRCVTYNYAIEGEWKKYYNLSKKMELEYSLDISIVPKSVLIIPFICNVLPIVWLCDGTLDVDEVDKDFYDDLEMIKNGYQDMYPMFEFKGKLNVRKVVKNISKEKEAVATLFSGGVDAYTTLLRHIDEKPYLITLWGADVKLDDIEGWRNVEAHIKSVSEEYSLKYIVVKTNFREIINIHLLDTLVKKSFDMWWHGFQHGIAIIGHMAPIAYKLGIKYTYIASSYPEKMKGQYTCASDPTIDNYVSYCGCKTIHDGYELDRQEKVKFLVEQKKEGNPIRLHVCWISAGGKNCSRCEKCYRTILEIVSECGNPNDYGFVWKDENISICKKDMLHKITLAQFNVEQFYYVIQKRMVQNKDKIANYEKYQWFIDMNFDEFNNYPMKRIRRTLIGRGVAKIYRMLKG